MFYLTLFNKRVASIDVENILPGFFFSRLNRLYTSKVQKNSEQRKILHKKQRVHPKKKIFVPKGYYSCFSQDLFLAIIRHLCLPVSHDSFLKVLNNITHHESDHVQCKYIQVSLLCKTIKKNFGPTFDRQKSGCPKKF